MDNQAGAEMPKYKCHKEVYALQIKSITLERRPDGKITITPMEERYAPFEIDRAYLEKHKPEVGGYYVVYKDGYKSYSPAKAFQEGYTKI